MKIHPAKKIFPSEYSIISELIKGKDLQKKIIHFDINSKRKIILILFKKNLSDSDAENLGANFYDQFKGIRQKEFYINSDTTSIKTKHLIGNFLHGIKLKSYNFDKYKTQKKKNNISINLFGKNILSTKEQLKFNAIEEGTFYTRDLVSEPGNILHPDEYAKRLNLLKKVGLKVNIID